MSQTAGLLAAFFSTSIDSTLLLTSFVANKNFLVQFKGLRETALGVKWNNLSLLNDFFVKFILIYVVLNVRSHR